MEGYRRTMRQAMLAAVCVATYGQAIGADACSELKAVIAAGERSESLRGPSLPDDRWSVRTKLGGWDKCYLSRVNLLSLSYYCESAMFAERGAAQEYVDREAASLKRCSGPASTSWSTRGSTSPFPTGR